MLRLLGTLLVKLPIPFLTRARAPHYYRQSFRLHSHILLKSISRFLYLNDFSIISMEVFLTDGTAMSINTLPEFLIFYDNIRSVCFDFSVSLNWHVPEFSYIVILGNIVWLVFIPSLSGFDFVHFAYLPMHICCYLVMSVGVLFFASSRLPVIKWTTVSSDFPQIMHFGLVPSLIMW